jgi:hypothetical protein
MANKLRVNEEVLVSDFTINGIKFSEKFAGSIATDNKDGTYLIHIRIQGRLATVMVAASSIFPKN